MIMKYRQTDVNMYKCAQSMLSRVATREASEDALKDEILSRFCSTRVLPTHERFGAMPSARTPFHAGVERAESAQGDSVAAGAWQGLTHYVSGPVCVHMCAL